ncbi:MAG: indolepyruvate ferredoxin oxidoreductase family protein [Pseudomonadota bacterium]
MPKGKSFDTSISLKDKFDLNKNRIFVSGVQALLRLVLAQKERDRKAGHNTAGYITGYRGSPVGGIDLTMWRFQDLLKQNDIVFQSGQNEDLAATALWGTQQAELRGDGKYDGVFGIWYGKGPGVDRSGDVFRHANLAGTSKFGGVVAVMGDDHTCESSTTAHQSEFHFLDVMMPVLHPAGVQEIVDFGLFGYALSRYAGVWVGLKCLKDTIESTAVIDGDIDRLQFVEPTDFEMPKDGLNIRTNDHPLVQEARLQDYKRDAIVAFVRANKINKTIISGGKTPKVGIITTGKSYLDVRQALDGLGIDEIRANALGIRLFKIGCVWPIPPEELKKFARGLDTIIVVEEKRSLIEVQVREELYGTAHQPTVVGKKDEKGNWLFPVKGALDSNNIAIAIGERVLKHNKDKDLKSNVDALKAAQEAQAKTETIAERVPYFCAGCPHSSSTHVPEGSRAYAGIGCHYMAQWMDRKTEGYTQMGGEGANWIGEFHFSNREHVFQNLGDGTYNHSGHLAVRAAANSDANITYKILYNDAVAMTGGQPNEGNLTVDMIASQVAAEGAQRVVIVTDEPDKYPSTVAWPLGTTIHHRSELMEVQKELSKVKGLSVMIYDQTCASEKRRRRKRGMFPDPDRRAVINEQVCEGCGDCGVKSNCVAVTAVDTDYGRKRQIDQSACNKDFSCTNGFCPSFVTVHGGKLRKGAEQQAGAESAEIPLAQLPAPTLPEIDKTYGVVVTGVGGTGVVTVGAIIGMAAHLEGKGSAIIDMAGLAQKGGAVASHLRIAKKPSDINSIRITARGADLILGCDVVTAGTAKVMASVKEGETRVVVNSHETLSGSFTHNVDFSFPVQRILRAIRAKAGNENTHVVEAKRMAIGLMGDAIAANMFMLGFAWQNGGLPISAEAILKAIDLNGVAVKLNQDAFNWGRVAAHDMTLVPVKEEPGPEQLPHRERSANIDELIERRADDLTRYQNATYANRYRETMDRVRAAEASKASGKAGLSDVIARNLFKLMAIKDEYEVARLYTDGSFERQLSERFESWERIEFHMAPPLFSKRDANGHLVKSTFGPWMRRALGLVASLKGLRGSTLDVFGYTQERRMERRLLSDYEAVIDRICSSLTPQNHSAAMALANYPEKIRGFGHVKEAAVKSVEIEKSRLEDAFADTQNTMLDAAE